MQKKSIRDFIEIPIFCRIWYCYMKEKIFCSWLVYLNLQKKIYFALFKRKISAVKTIPENVKTIPMSKLNTCFLYTGNCTCCNRFQTCKNNAAKNFNFIFQIPCWGWGVNNFDRGCEQFWLCTILTMCTISVIWVQFQLLNNFEQQ